MDDSGSCLSINAPTGQRFAGAQVHMVSVAYNVPPGAWHKPDAYEALLAELAMGLEPCDDPSCDYCAER